MFKTNRGLLKYCLLNLITFGIYSLVVKSHISEEINIIATKRDGRHTMHYLWIALLLSWLTSGIAYLIWYHKLSKRIGEELKARNSRYDFGADDFWLWKILASLIIIGPFVYYYKLFKATNIINASYLTDIC